MTRAVQLARRCGAAALLAGTLFCTSMQVQAEDNLAGVYVGEQAGPYMQSRLSSKTAFMFSAAVSNSSNWLSADIKYYLGDYADSVYVTGGLTYAEEQGFPPETFYRAGAGWEIATEGRVVYGLGVSAWWNQTWPQPVVRGGIYIAYYR